MWRIVLLQIWITFLKTFINSLQLYTLCKSNEEFTLAIYSWHKAHANAAKASGIHQPWWQWRVSCSSEWPWACDSWTFSHYELGSLLMTWQSGRVQGRDEVTQCKVHPVISTGWSFEKGFMQKKTERHVIKAFSFLSLISQCISAHKGHIHERHAQLVY